jgi:uncharacterized protein (TIGR02391 family)
MILTDKEMQQVRQTIEAQAGLDEELVRRCAPLIHLGKFDEAVRSAFVLLEERLRKAVNKEGMTGTQLAIYAFDLTEGPLAKHLGHNDSERRGLRELYAGAFRLFRNPTAHSVVGYSAAEGKAILGLVDLLLRMLKRAEELPPPDLFPDNVEIVLEKTEETMGPGAASRLRTFLGKCVRTGIKPSSKAKWSIPFRRYGLWKHHDWDEPKSHRIAMFYVEVGGKEPRFYFPVSYYYGNLINFDVERLVDELTEMGFRPSGKYQEPRVDLRLHNDQEFFDALFDLLVRTSEELDDTLQQR